ncbi:heme ABC exporter ATP-binding protein CcmA [Sphingomonas jeddahensis]|uniref:Cytochrome c biogenesis ATP-binding export protein CcmA n=1 Tax=Sphingomonas jeddahensis TaxID=1915074 RepID=A0A1V2ES95_9SPHN|nr:heme ABC exporter ATP-binding protein CcmA [Sphingomonas jeddahensis]ONF95542.1 Cytochrome c biogenesis ATP-binding export protein CcmA [Sphingomonas jeddahensis]
MIASLALSDVACRRGGRLLFAGVSLSLGAGGAALISGPNGCGKSSLLRLVAGFARSFAGTISVTGRVALLGEASALDGDRRLASALLFWARLDGLPDPPARVADALAAVALDTLGDVPVRLLSTGQRRRAALARVIAGGAGLWLLDEPATGLDVASIALLEQAIARHRAAGGVVLVATHQPLDVSGALTLDLFAHQPVAA